MRKIILSQDKFALVDDEDYEELNKYKWSISTSENGNQYAFTTIRMHRVVLNAPKGIDVDHVNGNSLDNTRKNLRLATKAQNSANSKLRKDNTCGFKGVTKWNGKYRARIVLNGKFISLGYFGTLQEAATAYQKAAKKSFGEFYNKG